MVLKLCGKGPQFARAYRFPGAHRTSNALDRLMHYQDRRLYAMRYLHGTPDAARLAVRAMALQWNFHPYGARSRRDRPDSSLSVPRPQRLRVPSQLAPQPTHRLLHGGSQTMNHEIRWNQKKSGRDKPGHGLLVRPTLTRLGTAGRG